MRYSYTSHFLLHSFIALFPCGYATFSASADPKTTVVKTNDAGKTQTAPGMQSAKNRVLSLYQSAKKICQNSTMSEQAKLESLTQLVKSSWNISKIAEYAIYPHWKKFSESEKNQFVQLVTEHIVRTFQKVSKKYLGALTIKKAVAIKNKKNAYDVYCEVTNKEDNRKVEVRFQIVFIKESPEVRNLFVENLDLVDAKRKDFIAIMRKNGQSIPKFLNALEKQFKSHTSGAKVG